MTFFKFTGRTIFNLFFLFFLLSCNQNHKNEIAENNVISDDNAITVAMEGKVFQIAQKNLESNSKMIFKKDSIFLQFWEDGNPLKLNFNLTDTGILETGAATYIIPEANSQKIKADLNFYNADRDTKRMNKRIIFRKGIIEIKKLTNNELQMSFEGVGGGMMEYGKNFPISGRVKVNY